MARRAPSDKASVSEPSRSDAAEPLWDDGEYVLSRVFQGDRPKAFLAKSPTLPDWRPATAKRLEHEYALRDHLNPAWSARPISLTWQKGRPLLLLEDSGGAPLARRLTSPLQPLEFLRVAINLTRALVAIHDSGIVHRDLTPANILVNSGSERVVLTGFGIASRLPRERLSPDPLEVVAGTLAYMAPEQTGRMNRSTDARSDLYSLGVVFYQMLAGELPFTAADPIELVHSHIARLPEPLVNRATEVPLVMSAIVQKLLAKNPEDRYQTAGGIAADLDKCLSEWESRNSIDWFPIGEHDLSDRLIVPERLYGREGEIGILLDAFERVAAGGRTELVLVSGGPGIGKSSLVNELHKVLLPRRGLFAAGKFDQYNRDVPYATLVQAFRGLVSQLLALSEETLRPWRDALGEALGPNGQLIVNLVPELEIIVGVQSPVAELSPQEMQRRLQEVFARFIAVFAKPEHPLVLFFDDLQWLDAATLAVLEPLAANHELRNLLLIGSYRDNEVGPLHPLNRSFDTIKRSAAAIHEILLQPLTGIETNKLIADTLHCQLERARTLSQLVHEKTGGNPFFVIQFMSTLADERLLLFDRRAAGWTWSLHSIRAKGFTDNVADLMVARLTSLPPATQELLKQLACLGNSATVGTLIAACGGSQVEIDAVFWDSIRAGLVFCTNETYTFLHDRVRETAYSLIPSGERALVHLELGRRLVTSMSAEQVSERIFDVVTQFNHGVALISDPGEIERVANLNLGAGRRAKASTAYAAACGYFNAAIALLGSSGWQTRYGVMLVLMLELAESTLLAGQFEEAERLIAAVLERAISAVDKAAAYRLKLELHIVQSQNTQAVTTGIECLSLLGFETPANPTPQQVEAEYRALCEILHETPIESLIDLPLMRDTRLQAAARVLAALLLASFYTDVNLFVSLLCRLVALSITHGTTEAATQGFALFGWILGPVFHRYRDGYRFGRLALDLAERRRFLADTARAHYAMGMTVSWDHSLAESIEYFQTAIDIGIKTGDLFFVCSSTSQIIIRRILAGDPLADVWNQSEEYAAFARRIGFRDGADLIVSQQFFIRAMAGEDALPGASDFDQAAFESQLTEERMSTMVCWYWILKIAGRFVAGDYAGALEASDRSRALLWSSTAEIQLLDYHYFTALTLAALATSAVAEQQREWRERIDSHCEQLKEWAEMGAAIFLDRHALVSAELARLEGREIDAEKLYETAIQSAREHGLAHSEAIASEVAARFYAARDLRTVAAVYMKNARACFLRWGAKHQVKRLDAEHPELQEDQIAAVQAVTLGTSIQELDLATVVRMSQAVSGEIVLENLIERLLTLAVQHAGAARGLLIVERGEETRIEAEAITEADSVVAHFRRGQPRTSGLPDTLLQYVQRSREAVVLDDASAPNPFASDPYLIEKRARSVMCLPLVKQTRLVGVIYLENDIASQVFTPARIELLKILASQAAISLENAVLYSELRDAQARLSEAQRLSKMGSFGWQPATGDVVWSAEAYRIFEFDRTTKPTTELMLERTHPADRERLRKMLEDAPGEPKDWDITQRIRMPDGRVKHLRIVAGAALDESSGDAEHVGSIVDVTAATESRLALEKAYRDIEALKNELQNENVLLREQVDNASIFEEIVGSSRPLLAVLSRVEKVAPTESTVLITGETGTGKELIAKAIHKRSSRANRPFVSVNCAAIPTALIASELFGHEKGAFTGALQKRLGRFALAAGGTIFLDEIGELPSETQVALLRVLQEHEFEPVGGQLVKANVRVICATNRDLAEAIAAGSFRSDLFYRLNVFPIEMPSLRERRDDIPMLAEYFIDRFARAAGKRIHSISRKTLQMLQSYPWPGNIRELQNVIERSVILCDTDQFDIDESWLSQADVEQMTAAQTPLTRHLDADVRRRIEAALSESGGRVSGPAGAAVKLGMPASTLASKIRALGINKYSFKRS
ncbi:MAG TPA: sigma 54-interacting transcriptional regulator [Candidatus Binataceae bacterium]|nr:sigma 54-interacting transcriptional regulator [Candidatus Binataceae bacterium]